METVTTTTCEHRWRYFVDIESRAVRIRECERCGRRSVVPTTLAPLPRTMPRRKISA